MLTARALSVEAELGKLAGIEDNINVDCQECYIHRS